MTHNDIRHQATQIVRDHIQQMAGTPDRATGSFSATIEGIELRARLISVDRLGCEFEFIDIRCEAMKQASLERLQAMADRLSKEISYLEERLIVLEVDAVDPNVQLRSAEPRREEQQRSYFELQVGHGGLTLRRFGKLIGQRRECIPATLTRDVFYRVCADLMAAVHEELSRN